MGDKFEEHYRRKTDKELYQIFKGFISSTYNEKTLAQRILDERNFNFENVKKYTEKWELESISNELKDENRYGFFRLNPFAYLTGTVGAAGFWIFYIVETLSGNQVVPDRAVEDIATKIFGLLLPPIFAIMCFSFFRKERRWLKNRSKKKDEITRKLIN